MTQEAAPARRLPLPGAGGARAGRPMHIPPNPQQEAPVLGPNEAEQVRPAEAGEGSADNTQQQGSGSGERQAAGQDFQQFVGQPGAGVDWG